jgi:xanthine dehydrogenase large subunit
MRAPKINVEKAAIDGGVRARRPHDSGHKHVSGEAIYVDDMREPPGTLKIYIAMSERAHAVVKRLEVAMVRSAPGVAIVLTAKEVPGINDVSPFAGDDPMFADGLVQYCGQSLFAVAADTIAQARAAARLAVVEYADRPALLTVDAAMQAKSFLESPYTLARGDAKTAIAAAPHVLEGRCYTGGQEHFYLEGQVAFAVPGEDEDVTVHCSSQHPSEIQHVVARVLGVPSHAVTVEVRRMGGGFGGKESQANLPAAVAALVAKRTGRPAKCCYDRDDDMIITGKRHDFRVDYRVGFDGEGRILGVEFDQCARCGMSIDLSLAVADRAMFHADNAYYLPAARITSYRCKTHTQSNTAFRGFGAPQGILAMERVIDEIAHTLGRDPLDVRQINFYDHKDAQQDAAKDTKAAARRNLTPYHQRVEDCVIEDIVVELEASSAYRRRRQEIRAWNSKSPVLKRGIALTPVKFGISFTNTMMNQAGALVHVYADGSIALNHGGTEMGQGLNTKVAQVVAEEFQVDIARIKITATHTGKVPNTSPTAASSGSDLNGMAARNAAQAIKARLVAFLAERHQAETSDVLFLPDRIRIRDREASFDEVVGEAYRARIHLSAAGFYATPKIHWHRASARGRPFFYFAYGAAVSEVAIDTLTGENRILRTDILHDVGQSLNPAIDLGQVEGGFVQGAGWLTMEELVWDAQGRLLTHAPSTYKIPACSDRPIDLRIGLWDKGRNVEETIYRSKAVGEPPLMLGISVLLALSDAVASVGGYQAYPALDAPATPERVLLAVERIKRLTAARAA